jgi:hypothetical protein
MLSWSRSALVVVAVVVGGAGCRDRLGEDEDPPDAAGTMSPPPPPDAGATQSPPPSDAGVSAPPSDAGAIGARDAPASDAAWPLARTHRLTTDSVEAVELATNGSAVFGLIAGRGVWTLAAGETAVRMLVAPRDISAEAGWGRRIVAVGSDVFWLDRPAGVLHRTRADGSGDDVLADGLYVPDTLAIDDTHVYWSELAQPGQLGGVVRSLRRDAAPDDEPVPLVAVGPMYAISSLAVSGGTLYWTSYTGVVTTDDRSGLYAAATDAPPGDSRGIRLDGNNPFRATATGGAVLYGTLRDTHTNVLMDLPSLSDPPKLLSILPAGVVLGGLAATDDWLIVTGRSSAGWEIHVAPRTGAGLVRIAQGIRCPAILGPAGITFIDGSGALVFIETDDLGYVGLGRPAP